MRDVMLSPEQVADQLETEKTDRKPVMVRLSARQREIITEGARRRGLTVSSFLRRVGVTAALELQAQQQGL